MFSLKKIFTRGEMKFLQVTTLFLLLLVYGNLVVCQYDSRGIWGIAVDAIVEGTRVRASVAAAQQELIQDCTRNGYCGY